MTEVPIDRLVEPGKWQRHCLDLYHLCKQNSAMYGAHAEQWLELCNASITLEASRKGVREGEEDPEEFRKSLEPPATEIPGDLT